MSADTVTENGQVSRPAAREPIEFPRAHAVSEVICVKCGTRWLAIRPVGTLLKDLECSGCNRQGFVIETGQTLGEED